MPVGEYLVELVYAFEIVTALPLEKIDADSTSELVTGVLTTSMPAPIVITRNETTPLVLELSVAKYGNVTFGKGTLAVSIDVDEVPANGLELRFSGTLVASTVNVGAGIPPALLEGLTDQFPLTLHAKVIEPWVELSLTRACAPARVDVAVTSTPIRSALLHEEAEAIACIVDEPGYTAMLLHLTHAGPAVTALIGDAIGPQDYSMFAHIGLVLPDGVYDGETIDFEALASPQLTAGSLRMILDGAGGPWYEATHDGEIELQATGLL
jgi:hypothetical protein